MNQLAGNYGDSQADFQSIIDHFDAADLEARIKGSKLAAQGASLLTNDNVIPYSGSGYERILTHNFQAFNYLGQKDREGAGVELRKAGLEQRILLERHEKEIAEAHKKASEKGVAVGEISKHFVGMDEIAGRVKNSFQNAYTFYTSAAFWEATGELNSALVDYKKAYEINRDSTLLPKDISRVSARLGIREKRRVSYHKRKKNEGVVVVLYEDGYVPPKQQLKIPVPVPIPTGNGNDVGAVTIAFPYYKSDNWPSPNPLAVSNHTTTLAITEKVADVGALAVKALKEDLTGIIVRQVLRAASKYEMQHQANSQLGQFAQIATSVTSFVTENADLRSWLTLPNTAQVARIYLPAGNQSITVRAAGMQKDIPLRVKAATTTFVRVVGVAPNLIIQTFEI